jgi:membrane protein
MGLSPGELGRRVWRGSSEDNVFGTAAELAFYFMLSLFPMLIFLASLVGFLPGLRENILASLAKAMPDDAMSIVNHTLRDAAGKRSPGLLSFGVIGSLLAASNGVVALIGTLNTAYEVKERRAYWKLWLIALALTMGLSVLVIAGSVLIMFGDRLGLLLSGFLGLRSPMPLWEAGDYLSGLALLFVGIEAAYYFGPDTNREWQWVTPGAVFAVIATAVGSVLFSLYLRLGPRYSATYGSLGAVIVLMLWLYLVGLAVLIGGEINSAIEAARRTRQPQVWPSPSAALPSQP